MFLSALLVFFSFVILIFFGYIYRYSTINTYNSILLILILLIILITVLFILSMLAVFYTYKNKTIGAPFFGLAKLGLNILLPIITVISGFIKHEKDGIRAFYIDVNNILVQSTCSKYPPGQILMLLPHCLQNTDCGYKITNDINNCHRCGRCCIGDIAKVVQDTGVKAVVVTGGTVARKIVGTSRAEVVLSVACERDLSGGIADIGRIPVIGVLNERPNGPCINTTVNVDSIKNKLEKLMDRK